MSAGCTELLATERGLRGHKKKMSGVSGSQRRCWALSQPGLEKMLNNMFRQVGSVRCWLIFVPFSNNQKLGGGFKYVSFSPLFWGRWTHFDSYFPNGFWNHQHGCVYGFKLPTPLKFNNRYCWWKKSCTSWYGESTIIYRIWCISAGAGRPSIGITQNDAIFKTRYIFNTSIFHGVFFFVFTPFGGSNHQSSGFNHQPPDVPNVWNGLGCTSPNPYHPWDWYIYLHLTFSWFCMVNVGKYTSPMDALEGWIW